MAERHCSCQRHNKRQWPRHPRREALEEEWSQNNYKDEPSEPEYGNDIVGGERCSPHHSDTGHEYLRKASSCRGLIYHHFLSHPLQRKEEDQLRQVGG